MAGSAEEAIWRAEFERQERAQVRANLANYGEPSHPDDYPAHAFYLKQKYVGTGLSRFLRRIEGKPEPELTNLFADQDGRDRSG